MKRLMAFVSSFGGFFFLLATIANLFLAFRASERSRLVVTTNVVVEVHSITNTVTPSSSSVPGAFHSDTLAPRSIDGFSRPPSEVAQYPYKYYIFKGKIGAWIFGRPYYEGSPCSFGVIRAIYPDRILLVGGDWITNRSPDGDLVDNRIARVHNDKR